MGQRCTQQGTAAAGSRQSGNHFHFGLCFLSAQFINQSGHAINAAVTGTDHCNRFPLLSFVNGHLAPLCLPGHRGIEIFLVRIPIPHQIHIYGIADDGIAVLQRPVCPDGHILIITGANAHNDQLTQIVPPNVLLPAQRSLHYRQSFLQSVFPHRSRQRVRIHYPPRSHFEQMPRV